MSAGTETVFRAYAAMRGGDVVALVNTCAADVEWRMCGPTVCARAGHEGVAEWLLESEPHLADVRFTPRSVRESEDDIVVIGLAEQRESGAWRAWERVHIWRVEGEKVRRVVEYDATV